MNRSFDEEVATMKAWKKVLVGSVSGLTLLGGINLAALAAGRDDAPAGTVRIADDHGREAEQRGREAEPGDDRGREAEQRGRENENEVGDDRGQENENEAEDDDNGIDMDADDNSGPSDNAGPSDHSGPGRSGHDDGRNHDRGDDN
jgi:hypothetical protein